MRFRTLSECAGCGQRVGGINCLPTTKYLCPNCGARVLLCPLCQGYGLDCPACEDTMRPEWEFREETRDNTRQKSISEYMGGDDCGGA